MGGKQVYVLQEQAREARQGDDADLIARTRGWVTAAQAQVGGPVYRIPAQNLGHLQHEIETKVNKRAAKLGLAPVEIIELEQEVQEYETYDENGHKVKKIRVHQYVAIKGETPKIAGYEFVATIQHEEVGNIIREIPTLRQEIREIEMPDLTQYRTGSAVCEHCSKSRNRKDTYIVWNQEENNLMQVGSNCLGDFLGSADPQRYAKYAEYLRDFFDTLMSEEDDERSYGPRVEKTFSLREYLASVNRMIKTYGWTPRSAAQYDGRATADAAWYNLVDYGKKTNNGPEYIEIEAEDYDVADEVIAWVREQEPTNDFMHNLIVATGSDYITNRMIGFAAAAINAHAKAVEREINQRVRKEQSAASEFVGTVGERQDFVLTLTKEIPIEDRYSYDEATKPLYVFVDQDGNAVKWFSSRWLDIGVGQTYTMTATVKGHDDHETYGKSTLITRAKVKA